MQLSCLNKVKSDAKIIILFDSLFLTFLFKQFVKMRETLKSKQKPKPLFAVAGKSSPPFWNRTEQHHESSILTVPHLPHSSTVDMYSYLGKILLSH